jgi:tryptophanyl-tRNA synthetase
VEAQHQPGLVLAERVLELVAVAPRLDGRHDRLRLEALEPPDPPQGILDLLDEPGRLRKKIMRAVTDTGGEVVADDENKPGITNLLRIHSALSGTPVAALEEQYAGKGYGAFKKDVAEVVVGVLEPFQERYRRWIGDEEGLDTILAAGAERARAIAAPTMVDVREKVGFLAAKQ